MCVNNRSILFGLVICQCVLTVFHHLYGEFALYKDGVRLHAAFFAPFALLLTFAPLFLHKNRIGRVMFSVWCATIWIGVIGLFEGGWNHLVINVVNAFNPNHVADLVLFRSAPGDLIFEISGFAQFLLAIMLAYSLFHFNKPSLQGLRQSN